MFQPPVFNVLMKAPAPLTRLTANYRQLRQQLSRIGYISQGSVIERSPTQQGSRYIWTRKVQAKTITVALSEEQYQWLRRAVANQRKLDRIVGQMQQRSRKILFETLPEPRRRKSLSKSVLGLI